MALERRGSLDDHLGMNGTIAVAVGRATHFLRLDVEGLP
jgi:hypothetical protein